LRRALLGGLVLVAALLPASDLPSAAAAGPGCTASAARAAQRQAVQDCAPGSTVLNILPPGEDGRVTPAELIPGSNPPQYLGPVHQQDQLRMYSDLKKVAPNLTAAQLNACLGPNAPPHTGCFYKDASFGVDPNDICPPEPTTDPCRPHSIFFTGEHSGTVILRDKSFGVPHVFGTTREDTEYGAGYAAAEDRLFLMDLLRHVGRSRASEFLGPSQSTMGLDCMVAQVAGYSEDELDAQAQPSIDTAPFDGGITEGERIKRDGTAYVAGINQYVTEANADPLQKRPAEYSTLVVPGQNTPQPWSLKDVAAVATIVQAIFAVGGGNEVASGLLYEALTQQHPDTGAGIWTDLREQNDPEAQVTVKQAFPYMTEHAPADLSPAGVAMPAARPTDMSCRFTPPPTRAPSRASAPGPQAQKLNAALAALIPNRRSASNALLVGANQSADGHPIAVFGPQVAYFAPEILHEEDLHSGDGTLEARGAAFPGTDVYVELGRGVDYAWSATSASSDIVDERLERLCDAQHQGGGPGTDPGSQFYVNPQGQCVHMYERTIEYDAGPSVASTGQAAHVTIQVERTIHGPVIGRTTALSNPGDPSSGRIPVAIAYQRSTWFNELGAAAAFLYWNDPQKIHGPRDFFVAAGKETGTFNWFYVDSRDIAYYSSGQLPVRSSRVNPNFPSWGDDARNEWSGFTIRRCDVGGTTEDCGYTAAYLRSDGSDADPHPHAINPEQGTPTAHAVWMTNWNNKPAPQWSAADMNYGYGETYRSQSLSDRVVKVLRTTGGHAQPVDIVNAMEDGGSVDLQGAQLVQPLHDLLTSGNVTLTPQQQRMLDILYGWYCERPNANVACLPAAHRRGQNEENGGYDQGNAVAIMDDLYPRLVHKVFDAAWIGPDAYRLLDPGAGENINRQPGLHPLADPPGSKGSAYDASSGGWESNLQRAFRQAMNGGIANGYSQSYCGHGDASQCRSDLQAALQETYTALSSAYGDPNPDHWTCQRSNTGAGQCNNARDDIVFQTVGLEAVPSIPWINRPTFQQVIQFTSQRQGGSQGESSPTPTPQTGTPTPSPGAATPAPSPRPGSTAQPNAAATSGASASGEGLASTGTRVGALAAGLILVMTGLAVRRRRRRGRLT
jgi:acyl-homoserine lactone acylase PvdQ